MPARESLPDRRASWTAKARIPDAHGVPQAFYLTCGEYPDGRLGEIWIEASREGTFVRGVLGSLARMASMALQCGAPLAEVVASLRGLSFPPAGVVRSAGRGGAAWDVSSPMDWVARVLEEVYLCPPAPDPDPAAGGQGEPPPGKVIAPREGDEGRRTG